MAKGSLSFVVYRPCGCMCLAIVMDENDVERVREVSKEQVAAIKRGWKHDRVTVKTVRESRWRCDECDPKKAALPKPKQGSLING